MSDERAKPMSELLASWQSDIEPKPTERPNWCPGALVVDELGKARRMPCDRCVEADTGRCGPCAALERQSRQDRARATVPSKTKARFEP